MIYFRTVSDPNTKRRPINTITGVPDKYINTESEKFNSSKFKSINSIL